MTTQSLEKAFAEAAKLSAREQDALAALLMDEIAAEKQWDELFAGSQDVLAELAEEALAEHRKGETRRLDVDAL